MYFEIDDVKRRHTPYWDIHNVHGWVNPPEDRIAWHWLRGAFAGATGFLLSAAFAHRWEAYKTLRTTFHPPESFQQVYEFGQAIKKVGKYEAVRSLEPPSDLRLGGFRRRRGLG